MSLERHENRKCTNLVREFRNRIYISLMEDRTEEVLYSIVFMEFQF